MREETEGDAEDGEVRGDSRVQGGGDRQGDREEEIKIPSRPGRSFASLLLRTDNIFIHECVPSLARQAIQAHRSVRRIMNVFLHFP
ncbi:hypothetical protein E2C01_030232 [Portunus trituberculatus]|uniref:Uncharacterized protein n=1 Tax=Portunus trituberculatus TaxID=210409 RepID=A0A5B7EWR6_PORTR|nr:hypothetical protein [Portunus trituberculatus]